MDAVDVDGNEILDSSNDVFYYDDSNQTSDEILDDISNDSQKKLAEGSEKCMDEYLATGKKWRHFIVSNNNKF